jgi:hypothetical protein
MSISYGRNSTRFYRTAGKERGLEKFRGDRHRQYQLPRERRRHRRPARKRWAQ